MITRSSNDVLPAPRRAHEVHDLHPGAVEVRPVGLRDRVGVEGASSTIFTLVRCKLPPRPRSTTSNSLPLATSMRRVAALGTTVSISISHSRSQFAQRSRAGMSAAPAVRPRIPCPSRRSRSRSPGVHRGPPASVPRPRRLTTLTGRSCACLTTVLTIAPESRLDAWVSRRRKRRRAQPLDRRDHQVDGPRRRRARRRR